MDLFRSNGKKQPKANMVISGDPDLGVPDKTGGDPNILVEGRIYEARTIYRRGSASNLELSGLEGMLFSDMLFNDLQVSTSDKPRTIGYTFINGEWIKTS